MGALAVSGLCPMPTPVAGVVVARGLPTFILGGCPPVVESVLDLLTGGFLTLVLGWGWMLAVFQICATSSGSSVLDSCVLSRSVLMHVHPGGLSISSVAERDVCYADPRGL